MSTLYKYDGAEYKFNNQKFAELFMPEDLEMSRLKRKADMLKKTKLHVSQETIEAWYKDKSTPSDINLVIEIANYLKVDPSVLLVRTDEILEHIEDANKISPDRTVAATISNIKSWMLSNPANKSSSSDDLLEKWKAKYPNGMHYFIAYNVCILWLCELDTPTQILIAPFVFFLLLLLVRFYLFSYLKDEKSWKKIACNICKVFESILLFLLFIQAIYNWLM